MLPGDEFYMRAFYQLNTCRRFPGGPIPWTIIAQYSAAWRLTAEMAVHFSIIIRALDTAFVEWHQQERERLDRMARRKPDASKGKGARRR